MIEFLQDNLGPTWYLFILVPLIALILVFPMLGRGPLSRERDRKEDYRNKLRTEALMRAGYQCEAPVVLFWVRCKQQATEVEHIYPWVSGGPTILSNAQALCDKHNISRGKRNPPWLYVLSLENRRRGYFPEGEDVRVSAR